MDDQANMNHDYGKTIPKASAASEKDEPIFCVLAVKLIAASFSTRLAPGIGKYSATSDGSTPPDNRVK
jgi:hypothetical protein